MYLYIEAHEYILYSGRCAVFKIDMRMYAFIRPRPSNSAFFEFICACMRSFDRVPPNYALTSNMGSLCSHGCS